MPATMNRLVEPEDTGLSRHLVGHALVVGPAGRTDPRITAFAAGLPKDEENDLVVVDLPVDSSIALWNAVAEMLDADRRGIRLVIDGHPRESVALAAGWISERLGRVVIAADGQMFTGAGGVLFIDSGPDTGWMRFDRGQAPTWHSKRFPRPAWESELTTAIWATSPLAVCEPLPGGLWIRPAARPGEKDEPALRKYRARLIATVPLRPESLTIVVGSPGEREVPLADVTLVRSWLPPEVRQKSRLAPLGPVTLPTGSTLGQAVADVTGEELSAYNGLPIGGDGLSLDVRAVQPDGRGGGWPFALELTFRPTAANGVIPMPWVQAHRRPAPDLTEIGPGVYRHGPDTLVEVVQSGLLVRPIAEGPRTAAVRQVQPDSHRHLVVVDGETSEVVRQMRRLAEGLLGQFDEATRRVSEIVTAETLLIGSPVPTAGPVTSGVPTPPIGIAPATATTLEIPVITAPVLSATSTEARSKVEVPAAVVPLVEAAPVTEAAPAAMPFRLESPGIVAPTRPAGLEPVTVHSGENPVTVHSGENPVTGHSGENPVPAPDRTVRAPLSAPPAPASEAAPFPGNPSTPSGGSTPAPAPGTASTPSAPPAPAISAPVPAVSAPRVAARLQPTPPRAARGILPDRPIEEERAWLRKSLAQDFGTMSNAVARVLSEHPGFEGLRDGTSAALTDAVAVRLYLSPQGATLDAALRTGLVGPHIPFARCLVAGLARLPSHRGPTSFATTPSPEQWALLREQSVVTEWGFVNAVAGPCTDQPGDTDVVIWSMTGRRTRLLEPEPGGVPARVLFVPGTQFKILELTEPGPGRRGLILIRELTARDLDDSGQAAVVQRSFDDLALTSMHRDYETWSASPRKISENIRIAGGFGTLPGVV